MSATAREVLRGDDTAYASAVALVEISEQLKRIADVLEVQNNGG